MRMQRLTVVLGVALAVTLAACTGQRQPVTPEMQKQRGHYAGYSILPPQGEGWEVAQLTAYRQTYLRQHAEQPQYSAIMQAYAHRMNRTFANYGELKAFIEELHNKEPVLPRHQNTSFVYTPDTANPQCVRYRQQSDDHGAANRGDLPFLRLVGIALACPHPDRSDVVVFLDLSQRAPPALGSEAFEREADAFIKNFRLEKLPPAKP